MADENGNPLNLPSFRKELGEIFDEKLKPITDLLEKHDKKLDEHEASLQRARGARWAFGIFWAAATFIWEWVMHSGHK
jgi:hypothetical protein